MTDPKPSFDGIHAARERSNRRAGGSSHPIDWLALAGPVARALRGEPNRRLSRRTELRYGRRGSLAINLQCGVWIDFETGERGGVLDLVIRERRCDTASAMRWLEDQGLLDGHSPPPTPPPPRVPEPDDHTRAELVDALWHAAVPADETPARTYLAHRAVWPPAGVGFALPGSVRWLARERAPGRAPVLKWYGLPPTAAGALVCAWTRSEESHPRAVSLEALTRCGEHLTPRWRLTYGPRAGCTFTAQDAPPGSCIHVTEGELDALALVHAPWLVPLGQILAAGGTSGLRVVGGWAKAPVIIHADGDRGGRSAALAATEAIRQAGQSALISWHQGDPADAMTGWIEERIALRIEHGQPPDQATRDAWQELLEERTEP